MKNIAVFLMLIAGSIACAVTKTPHAGPATIPNPPAIQDDSRTVAKPQEVAVVAVPSFDCKCDVCKCVDCVCDKSHAMPSTAPEATSLRTVASVAPYTPVVAQPAITRTTYGQQYSACGPGGCGPAMNSGPIRRIFRGRR